MSKNKKILAFVGLGLDAAITLFLFVISIIMIVKSVTMNAVEIEHATGFIGFLQKNPTVYLLGFVVPLFILLAVNIIVLVVYVKKNSTIKVDVTVNDLSDEQKEALKRQLLEELSKK